jgi:hypothetical protein
VATTIDELVVAGVPAAVIVEGENEHVASEGRPEQDKLMVPLNPVDVATVTDETPVPPGAEITTCAPADGTAA